MNAAVPRRATFCYPDSHLAPAAVGVAQRAAAVLGVASGARPGSDPLDEYIEAQVHGPIRFDVDVETLVLDPCFRGTIVETTARQFPCPIEWHGGFRVTVDELRRYPSYRGTRFLESALAAAVDGVLDPHRLGAPDRATDPEVERS